MAISLTYTASSRDGKSRAVAVCNASQTNRKREGEKGIPSLMLVLSLY